MEYSSTVNSLIFVEHYSLWILWVRLNIILGCWNISFRQCTGVWCFENKLQFKA